MDDRAAHREAGGQGHLCAWLALRVVVKEMIPSKDKASMYQVCLEQWVQIRGKGLWTY